MKRRTNSEMIATLREVERHHSARYPVEERPGGDRRPVCSGCEVYWWPCPTIKILRGEWNPSVNFEE